MAVEVGEALASSLSQPLALCCSSFYLQRCNIKYWEAPPPLPTALIGECKVHYFHCFMAALFWPDLYFDPIFTYLQCPVVQMWSCLYWLSSHTVSSGSHYRTRLACPPTAPLWSSPHHSQQSQHLWLSGSRYPRTALQLCPRRKETHLSFGASKSVAQRWCHYHATISERCWRGYLSCTQTLSPQDTTGRCLLVHLCWETHSYSAMLNIHRPQVIDT